MSVMPVNNSWGEDQSGEAGVYYMGRHMGRQFLSL